MAARRAASPAEESSLPRDNIVEEAPHLPPQPPAASASAAPAPAPAASTSANGGIEDGRKPEASAALEPAVSSAVSPLDLRNKLNGANAAPAAAKHAGATAVDMRDHNPNTLEGETRFCFTFAKHGECLKKGCGFRHLVLQHPDVVASGFTPYVAQRDINPNSREGESRFCFTFAKHGECLKKGCGFRHLVLQHPDVVASGFNPNVDMRDHNPHTLEGETSYCFCFAKTGECLKKGCGFRHLVAEHPDVVAAVAAGVYTPTDGHALQLQPSSSSDGAPIDLRTKLAKTTSGSSEGAPAPAEGGGSPAGDLRSKLAAKDGGVKEAAAKGSAADEGGAAVAATAQTPMAQTPTTAAAAAAGAPPLAASGAPGGEKLTVKPLISEEAKRKRAERFGVPVTKPSVISALVGTVSAAAPAPADDAPATVRDALPASTLPAAPPPPATPAPAPPRPGSARSAPAPAPLPPAPAPAPALKDSQPARHGPPPVSTPVAPPLLPRLQSPLSAWQRHTRTSWRSSAPQNLPPPRRLVRYRRRWKRRGPRRLRLRPSSRRSCFTRSSRRLVAKARRRSPCQRSS